MEAVHTLPAHVPNIVEQTRINKYELVKATGSVDSATMVTMTM